ncbi:hypothetical protein ACU8KH_03222 [Lachancea thermotolerans]
MCKYWVSGSCGSGYPSIALTVFHDLDTKTLLLLGINKRLNVDFSDGLATVGYVMLVSPRIQQGLLYHVLCLGNILSALFARELKSRASFGRKFTCEKVEAKVGIQPVN